MPPADAAYPHLDHLLGAYFHQDFDVDGDVGDIVPRYVEVSDAGDVQATIADIRRFLQDHADDAETAFRSTFGPTIEPQGWEMDTRQWLSWVERLMVSAARNSLQQAEGCHSDG